MVFISSHFSAAFVFLLASFIELFPNGKMAKILWKTTKENTFWTQNRLRNKTKWIREIGMNKAAFIWIMNNKYACQMKSNLFIHFQVVVFRFFISLEKFFFSDIAMAMNINSNIVTMMNLHFIEFHTGGTWIFQLYLASDIDRNGF